MLAAVLPAGSLLAHPASLIPTPPIAFEPGLGMGELRPAVGWRAPGCAIVRFGPTLVSSRRAHRPAGGTDAVGQSPIPISRRSAWLRCPAASTRITSSASAAVTGGAAP